MKDYGVCIDLVLKGYLPKGSNDLVGQHWTVAHGERKKAASALLLALSDAALDCSTPLTSLEASRLSKINFAIRALFLRTHKKR